MSVGSAPREAVRRARETVPKIVRDALAAVTKHHLSVAEYAAGARISIPTATELLRRNRPPKQARCLAGVCSFNERARVAASRAELGLS